MSSPGVGGTGALLWLLFALFPIHPNPGAQPGSAKGHESLVCTSGGWRAHDLPSLQDHLSPGTIAPTRHGSRDSARFVYKPVYPSICYIECIYVGNMLASPVCRHRASCAPQHGVLNGGGVSAMPPLPRSPLSHQRPRPVPASMSACLSLSSALSTLR